VLVGIMHRNMSLNRRHLQISCTFRGHLRKISLDKSQMEIEICYLSVSVYVPTHCFHRNFTVLNNFLLSQAV
jgi:hypothetical protein